MHRALLLYFLLATAAWRAEASPATLQDGDIIFQTSQSSQSVAIQRATASPYSHMGIIFFRNGKPYVFEAIATVRYTPLTSWIARGKGGHYVIKRLKDAPTLLTSDGLAKLRATTSQFEGRRYDLTFEWSDDRIYCSELVWKLYDRALNIHIGELQHLKDFNLNDPVVKAKMRQRYGNHVPLEEPVISPGAMFRSPLLVTIAEN
ncbi:MAG TPA: YiiX family permuted papain-like enzyme [Terriglobales bacterium]|jgi:hypothetical protein|nr:YiiX family permuted papain-like enzyme [Terriglobales bacterium]